MESCYGVANRPQSAARLSAAAATSDREDLVFIGQQFSHRFDRNF